MIFSPFNPVLFGDLPFTDFPHVFSVSDKIMIECFKSHEDELPLLSLVSETDEKVYNLTWNCFSLGNNDVFFYLLRDLQPGSYVLNCGDKKSNSIIVTDNFDILSNTVLIQFSLSNNRCRSDIVTQLNIGRQFFDLRIPGGFKDLDWDFSVNNEQFISEDGDIIELYSVDGITRKLTIGASVGIPVVIGEMVNRALSCDLLYIDGERYCRKNDDTPNIFECVNDDRCILNVLLQPSQNIKLIDLKDDLINRIILRRTTTDIRQTSQGLRKI